jgi:hypothetical protein
MAFAVIAGVPVDIQSTNAPKGYEWVGEDIAAFGGNLKTTKRARRSVWGPWDTQPLNNADANAFVDAVGAGAVSCSGDAFGGTIACMVEITGERFVKDTSELTLDFKRIITVVAKQRDPVEIT